MANICRSLQNKIFFLPVLKSPTHIGFIGVKKNGSKISHLGNFKNKFLFFTRYAHYMKSGLESKHYITLLTYITSKKWAGKILLMRPNKGGRLISHPGLMQRPYTVYTSLTK
jgi:hypothetical protein